MMTTSLSRAAAWTMPWLAVLIVSAAIVFGMTAMVVGAEATHTEARSTAVQCEDRMLAYAVSTDRIPRHLATACLPSAR